MLPTKFQFIWESGSQAILVSDRLISKKSSPLKQLGQMNPNLVGSIFGRSSIKIAHLVHPQKYDFDPLYHKSENFRIN
jgi:hypothetical protein